MKTILLGAGVLLSSAAISQVSDSISLGAGYINEAYYSLETGNEVNVNNNNWDIAFDLSGFGATIKLNRRVSTMYVYPGSTEDWETLDTTGMLDWGAYTDSYDYWSQGAFNNCGNPDSDVDLGWGIYNTVTHTIDGERMFVIKLASEEYKKLYIEELASGIYTFKYANLDNTEEVEQSITKTDYTGKNFIYYSLESDEIIDREPASADWDIVFSNVVLELAPGYFGSVTYAFHNYGVTVSEIDDVPSDEAIYGAFEDKINTIGSDWKTFNMETFSYDIEDSLTYFVQTVSGDVWKLVFTGFNGGVDGKTYFTKEKVAFANLIAQNAPGMAVFPNPANTDVTVQSNGNSIEIIEIYNTSGQLVFVQNNIGQSMFQIDLRDLEEGFYITNVVDENNVQTTQKLIVNH